MTELFHAAISLVNLPYTVLLVFMLLYWALYLLGAFGSEALDFVGLDLDADVDVDVDADVDTDMDLGHEGHPSFFYSPLHFFYLGQVPIAIIFSILILSMWAISVLANHYLGNANAWVALALACPIVLAGLIVTKTILTPLAPTLAKIFDQSSDKVEIVGKRCVVRSLEATPQYGQAELLTKGAPILLNVNTREGVTLAQGDEAVVYDFDTERDVYLIAPLDVTASPKMEE